jgi:putative transposase
MVAAPTDDEWSSHRANAGVAESKLLTPHPVRLGLGADAAARHAAHRALFAGREKEGELAAIRRRTQGNYAFGSRRFEEQIAAMLGRRVAPGKPGRPAKATADAPK